MRRPTDIRETLHRLLTALHATTCDDQRISERRCIVYLQHYAQRHAKTNGYQRDVVSFTYSITRNDMRRPTDIRDTLYRLFTALHATTCEDQWISERRCIVYLRHYTQRHATTNGYQRDVVSFTYSITRNDMRRTMDIRETLYRLLTALRATTCDDQRISERRCIVYLQHYTQRHAKTDGYQRDVVSFTYSITRNDMRRPTDIRETLHRLLTALHATTCGDQRISERRCIVYLQHYTQRHAKTDGYQRDVVSFTYSITRNDMRRPTDIRETLHRLLTALHATTCGDQRISERRCIVYLQHYSQRHAETSGYQRDVVSFTYSITQRRERQWISERRCIVYIQHYTQRHATTNGYQRHVVSFIYSITRITTCEDQWISERRCIVYLRHYTQRHATTNGYQRDGYQTCEERCIVYLQHYTTNGRETLHRLITALHNDMRRPMDIRETLYRLLTALRAMTCDDQRISERRCIVYLRITRHAATNGYQRDVVSYSITYQRDVVSFTYSITQRHATTNGYQRDVASFTYCITRNDMRRPTDIRETFTYSITRNDMRRPVDIRETLYRLLYLTDSITLHATTCEDSITRNDMDIRQTL